MAAAFRPVNSPLTSAVSIKEESAPSAMTPRPSTAPSQTPKPMDDATTPTRANFAAGALASQKPLPTSPFPDSVQMPEPSDHGIPKRENSQHSRKSKDSDDMDMDESDGEGVAGDDGAGSDDESVNADGTKSKKKKSQRFYCTDYPPCNLSFTRSEHLARHIRYVIWQPGPSHIAMQSLISVTRTGNTPANGRFNVIVPDAFRDSITLGNTRRRYM